MAAALHATLNKAWSVFDSLFHAFRFTITPTWDAGWNQQGTLQYLVISAKPIPQSIPGALNSAPSRVPLSTAR